jgi:hypothetical protein
MAEQTSLLKRIVKTPVGVGKVEDVYITELGYVMIKVKFKDNTGMKYVNYNIGSLDGSKHSKELQFI